MKFKLFNVFLRVIVFIIWLISQQELQKRVQQPSIYIFTNLHKSLRTVMVVITALSEHDGLILKLTVPTADTVKGNL